MDRRVAITGSSGYLGRMLVNSFLSRQDSVFGIDIAPAVVESPNFTSVCADVSDSRAEAELAKFEPDCIIHAAFVFQPLRNNQQMQEQNVGAFENIARITSKLCPKQFHLVSSATVYGTAADRDMKLQEETPFEISQFQYAADKQEIENRLAAFVDTNPEINVSWSRPSLIGGPNIDNYMSRFLFGLPIMALPGGNDTPLQFVHEEDVTQAIVRIIETDRSGPFNIGPDDSSPLSSIAIKSGRRFLKLPFWLCYSLHALAWHARFPIHESPPALLEFARHPWVVDSNRLVDEIGFQFQYSSEQTLDIMIQSFSNDSPN